MISCILALISGAVLLVADQLTKNFIVAHYTLGETYSFIPGVIDITYIHNKGGAWGMMNSYPWVLLSLVLIITVICIMLLIKYRASSKMMFWSLTLILSGGLGNLFDRVFRNEHSVVDFIHLRFIDFPIFNLADCAISVGAGLLVLYFIMDIIKSGKQKNAAEVPDTPKNE